MSETDLADVPNAELIVNTLEAMYGDEDEWEIDIREAELHALVSAHDALEEIVETIEDEFEYRVNHDEMRLAAGDDSDRAYAEEHA